MKLMFTEDIIVMCVYNIQNVLDTGRCIANKPNKEKKYDEIYQKGGLEKVNRVYF